MGAAPQFISDCWAVKAQAIVRDLGYPLPEGWQKDGDVVDALREAFPAIVQHNENLIAAELRKVHAPLTVSAEDLAGIPAIADALNGVDCDVISGMELLRTVLAHLNSEAAHAA